MDAREFELLERMWFPVARDEDTAAGPVAGELLGRRLVAFRSGEFVVVAADKCPHRGSRLSLGRVEHGEVECPYHGWRFGADGRCTLVPSQPGARPAAGLDTFPAVSRYGLVWTALAPTVASAPSIPEMDGAAGGWEI